MVNFVNLVSEGKDIGEIFQIFNQEIFRKEEDFDKEECFRIHTDKYYYFYVGHSRKELYQKQKKIMN